MKFTAAAIQMLASDDKAANLAEAARWIRQSAAAGAKLPAGKAPAGFHKKQGVIVPKTGA